MISKIIVKNNIRVGKFIGRLVNYDEDLLLNTSIEVKNFIRKNFDYLNSCQEKDMLKFFKLTGLLLGHQYIEKGSLNRIYFSLKGAYSRDYNQLKNKPDAYNHHLIIETYVDSLEVCNNKIIADGKEIYQVKNIKEVDVNVDKWNLSMLDTKERIKYLKEKDYLLPDIKDIKNILLDPLGNVLSLARNGNMYINDYLYCNEVNYIFELNSKDIKIIYKNHIVEDYSSNCSGLICNWYNKVLYNEDFLSTLKDGILCIYLYLKLGYNKSIYLIFDQVTDIKYIKKTNVLVISKDNKDIFFPLDSVMILS